MHKEFEADSLGLKKQGTTLPKNRANYSVKSKHEARENRALFSHKAVQGFINNSFDPYADKESYEPEKPTRRMTYLEKIGR